MIILLLVYIISAYLLMVFISSNEDEGMEIMSLIPILNTIFAIFCLIAKIGGLIRVFCTDYLGPSLIKIRPWFSMSWAKLPKSNAEDDDCFY